MFRLQAALISLFGILLLAGCGVVPRSSHPAATAGGGSSGTPGTEKDSLPRTSAMAVSSLNETKSSLMQAYREWKGTPYVLGGSSQRGVDCSRLVNIVFDDYFGIDLPTNTRAQLNTGEGIRRAGIRTGDLVFFKTGRRTLHVGIAVNKGEFLHASTSNGVMISKLGNSYWRNRFLAARRVL